MNYSNELLSVKQVAEVFGVTTMTVYNWINRKDIKAIKVCGHIVRISKQEIERLFGGVSNNNE